MKDIRETIREIEAETQKQIEQLNRKQAQRIIEAVKERLTEQQWNAMQRGINNDYDEWFASHLTYVIERFAREEPENEKANEVRRNLGIEMKQGETDENE